MSDEVTREIADTWRTEYSANLRNEPLYWYRRIPQHSPPSRTVSPEKRCIFLGGGSDNVLLPLLVFMVTLGHKLEHLARR